MCWKGGFLVSCAWPLLSCPLSCNDEFHAISSLPKKSAENIQSPSYASFSSSSVSASSTSTLSPTKIWNPSSTSQTSNSNPPSPLAMARTCGAKALSKQKSSHSRWFSSNMEQSGSSVPPSSPSSPSPCEILTGMDVTLSPSYYITPFIFGFFEEYRPSMGGIDDW